MNKGFKYIGLFLIWLVTTVIIILLLASLLLQTGPVKRKITRVAEKQISQLINGTLEITKIDGNFFSNLSFEGLVLTSEQDTLARIASFNAKYDLLSLLDGTIDLYAVSVNHPQITLRQNKDSTWNFSNLLPSSKETPQTTGRNNFELNLGSFKIMDGNLHISALDTLIPEEVRNLNTELSLYWSENKQTVNLQHLSLSSRRPALDLNQLKFKFMRDNQFIELLNFSLKTAQNQFEGSARLDSIPPHSGSATLQNPQLTPAEFDFFLPSLKIPATPRLNLDARVAGDSLIAELELTNGEQHFLLNLIAPDMINYAFAGSNQKLNYFFTSELQNIDLEDWIGSSGTGYLLNGKLKANGKGFDLSSDQISLSGDFKGSSIQKSHLNTALFELNVEKGHLQGFVRSEGAFGSFYVEPDIRDFGENPSYHAKLTGKNMDIAQITGNDSLSSSVNINATLKGRGFNPAGLTSSAHIEITDSRFQTIFIDTLVTNAGYQKGHVQIDSLWLKTRNTTLQAWGDYHFSDTSAIRLKADFNSLEEFDHYIPIKDLKTSGTLDARLRGKVDSLNIESSAHFKQSEYQQFALENLWIDLNGSLSPGDTLVNARVTGGGMTMNEIKLDSLHLLLEGNPDSLSLSTHLAGKAFETNLQTGISPGNKMAFILSSWDIRYKDQEWSLQRPPSTIEMDSVNYRITGFQLASGIGDTLQTITMQGNISREGEQDFTLEVSDLHIGKLGESFGLEPGIAGSANINLNLKGSARSPLLTGEINLNETAYKEYSIPRLEGTLDYENKQLALESLIIPEDSGQVKLVAQLPFEIDPVNMKFHFDPGDSINARLNVRELSLDLLQMLLPEGNISGTLNSRITVSGTSRAPVPVGNISLSGASFNMNEYGVDYEDIQAHLSFQKNSMKVDTLLIKSKDGNMVGRGQAGPISNLFEGRISKPEIILKFNQFNPFNHNQFNMQMTGDFEVSGETGLSNFQGDLTIPRAEFYLPAILRMLGKTGAQEMPEPLLVEEIRSMDIPIDSLEIRADEIGEPDTLQFILPDKLTGRLRLQIPRNTWIKNDNMRIEISGDLELIHNKGFPELFGSFSVVRGQYDMLGKTFVIREGIITFQGGREMMPNLKIEGSYTFRNAQRVEQQLTVEITGTADSPEISFELDGQSVSEGDALSYILFGKGMNELTLDQQENISGGNGGQLAEKVAASFLSAQISDFLGEKLNVDYIEIEAGENFTDPRLFVGKYVTNDLFISYEQQFGETGDRDLARYKVTLEYELFRFLFFELNNSSNTSGFDIILKYETGGDPSVTGGRINK